MKPSAIENLRAKSPVFLGERLRQLRKTRGLSLRRAAEILGLSAPFISDVERGRRDPSDRRLAQLMALYDVKYDDIAPHDSRMPTREIKARADTDPAFALALRSIIKSGATPLDIVEMTDAIEKERTCPDKTS